MDTNDATTKVRLKKPSSSAPALATASIFEDASRNRMMRRANGYLSADIYVAPPSRNFQHRQQRSGRHRLPRLHLDRLDGPVVDRGDLVFHLHRFQYNQILSGPHNFTGADKHIL